MKRMIRILTVAVLVAIILVASVSPAMARRISGGILLPRPENCTAILEHAQVTPAAEHLLLNPPERTTRGCWVELPLAAHN
jgi:hypothetical protein